MHLGPTGSTQQLAIPAFVYALAVLAAYKQSLEDPLPGERNRLLRKTFAQTLSLLLVEYPDSVCIADAGRDGVRDWVTVTFSTGGQVLASFDQLDRSARQAAAAAIGRPELGADSCPPRPSS